jgi:hypothetical protein
MLKDYYFWFTQPSLTLNNYDQWAFFGFAGMLLASLIIWVFQFFIKHPVVKAALSRWRNLLLTVGAIGLIWFGFRYESTPIFAKRVWAGGILLFGLAWLVYVLKFMLMKFGAEKSEYDNNQLKSKYLPQSRSAGSKKKN